MKNIKEIATRLEIAKKNIKGDTKNNKKSQRNFNSLRDCKKKN